jgi:hypothetical protein
MQANTPWASAATDLLVGCKCSDDLGPVIVQYAARFPDRLRPRMHQKLGQHASYIYQNLECK